MASPGGRIAITGDSTLAEGPGGAATLPGLRYYLPVLGPWVVATLALVVLVVTLEAREAEERFRQRAGVVFSSLLERVHANEVVLEGFAAVLRSLPSSDDGRVRDYARAMLARYPHLHKLTVSPRVLGKSRVPFESQMRLMGYPDYSVRTFAYDGDRAWRPAAPAEVHYPVAFVEPAATSGPTVLGLDLFSEPRLRAALLAAQDRNGTAATAPFDLTDGQRGYVLFRPVCATYQESCSGEAAESTPRLVAAMVVLAESMVVCDPKGSADLSCAVYHDGVGEDPARRLLQSRAVHQATPLERLLFPELRFQRHVTSGSQRLVLTASQQLGWRTFNVIPATALLALSAMGLALVLVAVRSRQRSEQEREWAHRALAAERAQLEVRVRERTRDLSQLNAELAEENAARRAVEERLALKERQARGLARRILGAQEEERRALARELHDDIGQSLTAIRTHARLIRQQTPDAASSVAGSAEAIGAVAADLYDSTHRLMRRLRPRALDDAGLPGAFESCVAAAELDLLGIRVHMQVAGDVGRLEEAVSITLYRVLQEALTNVARHSGAHHVRVCLARAGTVVDGQGAGSGDGIKLEVSDDGRGLAEAESSGGFGLVGLRERVEALGGTFELDSAPGRGVTLRVWMPLQAA